MKSPKIIIGVLLLITGVIMTCFFYAKDNYLETFGGLFFGAGVGLLIWYLVEKKNLIYKYPIDKTQELPSEETDI